MHRSIFHYGAPGLLGLRQKLWSERKASQEIEKNELYFRVQIFILQPRKIMQGTKSSSIFPHMTG